jgi:hypothetical protein
VEVGADAGWQIGADGAEGAGRTAAGTRRARARAIAINREGKGRVKEDPGINLKIKIKKEV